MKRSSSMQSNLSVHTHSSSGSTQRFDSSSESLALADFAEGDADEPNERMGLGGMQCFGRIPLAPVPRVSTQGDIMGADFSGPLGTSPLTTSIQLDLACENGVLGEGSTGSVRISSCGRVAWKLMKPATSSEAPLPAMETSYLHHPHLVTIVDRHLAGSLLCEARLLCTGGELFDEVAEHGGFLSAGRLQQAMRWFAQAASAVAHAHAMNAPNGQLRAEHVLLADDAGGDGANGGEPTVRLLGFEPPMWREYKHGSLESVGDVIAAPCPAGSPPTSSPPGALHPSGASSSSDAASVPPAAHHRRLPLHRPPGAHDAPELRGAVSATLSTLAAADVWSLGVLLTCLLTGQPPSLPSRSVPATPAAAAASPGDTPDSTMFLPSEMTAAPKAVLELVRSMLDPDPARRPSSAIVKARADALIMPPPSLGVPAPSAALPSSSEMLH